MMMSERKFAGFTWNADRKWFLCDKCGSAYCAETLKIEPERTVAIMICSDCDACGEENVVNRSTLFVYQPMKTFKPLTEADVKFIITTEVELCDLRTAFPMLSDEEIDEIRARLDGGDPWAFCTVVVEAFWKPEGVEDGFEGAVTLGCTSYDDEDDFKKGGYFEQMKKDALEILNKTVQDAHKALESRFV
jgi:hypothetical protein